LEEKIKSEKTKHNIISFLRSILNYAIEKDYIEDEILLELPSYSQKMTKKSDFLEVEEIKQLINEIPFDDVKDIITFLSFTGLRISEALGLRFCDIDFKNKSCYYK
jgi:integrase